MAHNSMSGNGPEMRSVVSRVRHLGAAGTGTRDLWLMRVTSAALLLLTIAFLWIVLSLAGKDLAQIHAEFAHPWVAVIMLLFVLASIVHMKIGMQSIIDDYIHAPLLKEWAMIANICFCVAIGVAAAFAILKLGGI